MDKLPSEILCRIFLEAVPHQRSYPPSTSITIPLQISHVCRHWRKLSLSYGTLWSYLFIDYNGYGSSRQRKAMQEIFDTWLQRSMEAPLNFTFLCNLSNVHNKEAHRVAEHIIGKLIAQQWRWKDVSFMWLSVKVSSDFPGAEMHNMPLLKSLYLDVNIIAENGQKLCTSVHISNSQRLTSLRLRGNFILDAGRTPMDALAGLCILRSHTQHESSFRPAAQMCLNLLRVAPNVKRLHTYFHCTSQQTLALEENQPFSHGLQSLKLEFGLASPHFIDVLTLPCLKALCYTDAFGSSAEAILTFARRSRPPLTYLEIYGVNADHHTLISILRLLPSLLELRLEAVPVSPDFFQELTVSDNASAELERFNAEHVICPALRAFCLQTLIFHDGGIQCTHALCTMLESRWRYLKSWKRILLEAETMVKFDFPLTADTIAVIYDFLEADIGLAIEDDDVPQYPFNDW